MAVTDNILSVNTLIGMPLLSRATGNKLGQVDDIILDPLEGVLLGLGVLTPDSDVLLLDYREVYSFGRDAVMANRDDSLVPPDDSRLAGAPRAKKDISGARVVTEGGALLGEVANVFVHVAPPPLVVYEVRESVIDKLLGRGLFIPASLGRALSEDAERIIVPEDTARTAAPSLEALAERHIAPLAGEETVVRRKDETAPPD